MILLGGVRRPQIYAEEPIAPFFLDGVFCNFFGSLLILLLHRSDTQIHTLCFSRPNFSCNEHTIIQIVYNMVAALRLFYCARRCPPNYQGLQSPNSRDRRRNMMPLLVPTILWSQRCARTCPVSLFATRAHVANHRRMAV